MAFSMDGRRALSGGSDGITKLWDVASGEELRNFVSHRGGVRSVALSTDDKLMLSGDSDGVVGLWEVASGRELKTFIGHRGAVRSVAFSLDGKVAQSGGIDGTIKLWEVASGWELRSIADRKAGILSVAFSSDGKLALSGGVDGAITLLDFSRADMYQTFNTRLPIALDAIHREPEDAAALAVVGSWYAFRGMPEWAAEFLEKARQKGAAVSPLTLARCYWQLNRFDDAQKELYRAMEIHEAPETYLNLCLAVAPPSGANRQ